MLTFLKSATGTLFAKIFLGLLIASFAVWGISGAAFNFASGTLASVGATKIKTVDFQREYQVEINRVGQQVGQRITSAQARQFGIDRQVLSRMVNEAALDNQANAFSLGVSDDRVADEILNDPLFQSANGVFDAHRYQQTVIAAGLSEKDFLARQKKSYAREQLIETLIGDVVVPDTLLDAVSAHINEERTVEYLEIDLRDIPTITTPDDAKLQTYFDANKTKYRAPEYRSIDYIAVQISDFGGAGRISDADAQQYYNANKERFVQREKRNIRRITFDTEAKARDAEGKLKDGTTFDALVAELGLTPEDVFLGVLSKEAILDEKLAEAAFKLDVKKPSGVVDGDFGKMIIMVDDIEGGSTATFESLKETIKTEMAADEDNKELLDKLDQVEDARAGGSTFAEIAAKYSLKLVKLKDVDQSGEQSTGGKISSKILGRDILLAEAFQSDVGLENDVIEVNRDGFVWYEVTDIKAERDRTLNEIKSRVKNDWIEDETKKSVQARADEIVKALKGGQSIQSLEEEMGREVTRVTGVKRNQPVNGLSDEAVGRVFNGAKGFITSAGGERNNQAFVLKVVDVANSSTAKNEEHANRMTTAIEGDVIATYITHLRDRDGSSINPEAFEFATDLDAQRGHGGHGGQY